MIRPARHQDIPTLLAMLHEMHRVSKYDRRCEISDKAAESLLEGAIASMGSFGPQGTHVILAEGAGKPVGFMIGVVDRIYNIGTKLVAYDQYLYARPAASLSASLGMIDSYIAWASGIRAVIEIKLSWTDTIPGASRIADLYRRKGFELVGEIWERRMDEAGVKAA